MIDDLLNKHADKLEAALEGELLKNPVRFWQRYGLPLVPQSLVAKVETNQTGGSPWVSMLDVMRYRDIEARAQAAGLEIPPPVSRARPWIKDGEGEG